jgi:hypothetical protein
VENLDSGIWEKIEDQAYGGINVHQLPPGTTIIARTRNSIYSLEIIDEIGHVIAIGGKHLPERHKVFFSGSTFGGSMLKVGWIGKGMHMEFHLGQRRRLTTTAVRGAKIIGTDNWEYDMQWEDDEV